MTRSREERIARQGLAEAFGRIAAATSEDAGLIALHEALGWVYSLEEFHRHRLGDLRYYAERAQVESGEVVAGMVWVRRFAAHELAVTTRLSDGFSDVMTEMFEVLVWRDESQLPPHRSDTYDRHLHYRNHLASAPVLDTLILARDFLTVVIPQVV